MSIRDSSYDSPLVSSLAKRLKTSHAGNSFFHEPMIRVQVKGDTIRQGTEQGFAVGPRTWFLHRAPLMDESAFFRNRFTNMSQLESSNVITFLQDTTAETVETFSNWLYTKSLQIPELRLDSPYPVEGGSLRDEKSDGDEDLLSEVRIFYQVKKDLENGSVSSETLGRSSPTPSVCSCDFHFEVHLNDGAAETETATPATCQGTATSPAPATLANPFDRVTARLLDLYIFSQNYALPTLQSEVLNLWRRFRSFHRTQHPRQSIQVLRRAYDHLTSRLHPEEDPLWLWLTTDVVRALDFDLNIPNCAPDTAPVAVIDAMWNDDDRDQLPPEFWRSVLKGKLATDARVLAWTLDQLRDNRDTIDQLKEGIEKCAEEEDESREKMLQDRIRIHRLECQVAMQAGEVKTYRGKIEQLTAQANENRYAIESLEADLNCECDGCLDMEAALRVAEDEAHRLEGINDFYKAENRQISMLLHYEQNQVSDLNDKTEARANKNLEDLNQLQENIDQLAKEHISLRNENVQLKAELDAERQKIRELEADANARAVEEARELDELQQDVDRFIDEHNRIRDENNELKLQAVADREIIEDLEFHKANDKRQLEQYEDEATTHRSKITELEAEVDSQRQTIERLESQARRNDETYFRLEWKASMESATLRHMYETRDKLMRQLEKATGESQQTKERLETQAAEDRQMIQELEAQLDAAAEERGQMERERSRLIADLEEYKLRDSWSLRGNDDDDEDAKDEKEVAEYYWVDRDPW